MDHKGDPIDPSVLLKKKKTVAVGFFSFAVEAKCTCFAVSFIIFPNGNRLLYSYIYIRPNYRFPTGKMRRIVRSKEYIQ